MANVGANVLFLGSEKSYFVGKIIKKKLCASDSFRFTASDYLLCILHLPS
jgi:hypothetical protein